MAVAGVEESKVRTQVRKPSPKPKASMHANKKERSRVSYALLKSRKANTALRSSCFKRVGNSWRNMILSPMWRPGKNAVCSGEMMVPKTGPRRLASTLASKR